MEKLIIRLQRLDIEKNEWIDVITIIGEKKSIDYSLNKEMEDEF